MLSGKVFLPDNDVNDVIIRCSFYIQMFVHECTNCYFRVQTWLQVSWTDMLTVAIIEACRYSSGQ